MSDPRPSPNDPAVRWDGDGAPTPLNPRQVKVDKDSAVIQCLGSLQELSAALGLARALIGERERLADFDALLLEVQRALYVVKCDVATPGDAREVEGLPVPRPEESLIRWIDEQVEALEEELGAKPNCFVLEGGDPASAASHRANEVARRAERLVVALAPSAPDLFPDLEPKLDFVQRYLNHLSYLLYLAGRLINRRLGIEETSIFTEADGSVVVRRGSFK